MWAPKGRRLHSGKVTLSEQPYLYVLVAGPPGSGKTTVSAPLAAELGLPLLAKDAIKEALMDALGRPADVEASRQLGRALTHRSRYTVCSSAASIAWRAALPIRFSIAPFAPIRMPFCDSFST